MLPKNSIASKSSTPRQSTECLKQKHLMELAMPSPASAPGAEHLSDTSSCCSMEDTDSNRSSGPDSLIVSTIGNSSSTPALDLKRKYTKQLGSAFCSDYRYLMDEKIIDSCSSVKSDLSFECDEQTARRIAVASFKEFVQQFTRLNDLLNGMLQKAQMQCHCLSERYVNQTFHKDMLNHLVSYKHFKDYARQMIAAHPHLTGDIDRRLRQVTGTWMLLERLLLPNANHSDHMKMLQDMELDFEALRQWVDDMEVKRCNWRLQSHWATSDILRLLEIQRTLQSQIESRSRVVRALLNLCERLMTNGGDVEKAVALEGRNRTGELKRRATDLQAEINVIWLSSLEWQMTLEDVQRNGIHLRGGRAEDDQWDRMGSTDRCKQPKEFQTKQELSVDFVGDEDSSYQSRSQRRTKPEYYEGLSAKDDDAVVPANESFTGFDDVDGCGLSGNCCPQMPGDYNSQDYSSRGTLQDYIYRNRSGCRSDLEMNPDFESVENKVGKMENDLYRGWPSSQPRSCGATDFSAASCGGRKDIPVDFGYSSGSHSNDETDNSAKHLFIWSHDRQSCSIDEESPDYISRAIIKQNIVNSVTGYCRNAIDEKMGVGGSTRDRWCFEGEDGQSLPGTEDEMSVELPLDDIPVFVSSDFCAEDSGGDVPKRPLAKMAAACKKKLCFTEPLGTGDWPLTAEEASPKGRLGIRQLENDPKMALAEKRNGERKTRPLSRSIPLSGSCYTSGEGTESESDFLDRNLRIEKHEREFGRHLKLNRQGSSSLRSSPVRELTEIVGGQSHLRQRTGECKESAFRDRRGMNRLWTSDGTIHELLKRDLVGTSKIPKMLSKVCGMPKSNAPVNDVRSHSKGADDVTRHAGNDRGVFGKLKSSADEMKNISSEPAEHILQCLEFFRCEGDVGVPNCDSLNSSLATDDIQCYNSDSDIFVAKEMQLDDDDYSGDNFEGYRIKDVKGRGVTRELARLEHHGMDSDSDREDFQHVLGESRRGLKFIEATIRQERSLSENNAFGQDTTTFYESHATCTANIVCLQELIEALTSKRKMDNEILQVTEMVTRWQQLQSTLLALHNEAQQVFRFQTEVSGIQSDLQNMASVVECDDRFSNIRQLEEAVEAVKAVHSKLNMQTDPRVRTLDVALKQFVCEDSDPQLFAIGRQIEQLKSCLDSLAIRCEAKEHKLQSALISWHKYINTQEELDSLFQLCDHSSRSNTFTALASGGASLEEVSGLQGTKERLNSLDEMLHRLISLRLDFADLFSESSALVLKQAMTLSSDRLQLLHQENDEKLMELVRGKPGCSFPETVDHQMALTSDVVPSVCPRSAALPLALAFVLASCLFAVLGDTWYELLGGLGLIFDPVLKYIRGPPPS